MGYDSQAVILAGARARSDAEFDTLAVKVAKRHRNAVLDVQQMVRHERRVTDLTMGWMRHLEEMIALKDATIATLKSNADGWREIARRHGANVDDALERSH
jgi:hypothetical protein